MALEDKYNSLKQILKGLGRVIVAYSGGVDSTFLLKVALDSLGAENVLACISAGPSLPGAQLAAALENAERFGVKVRQVDTGEMADEKFTANNPDRCFHCKGHLFDVLSRIAKEQGFEHIISGHNFDDLSDFRPGSRAAGLFNIRSPLAETELTKEDIRQLSRQLDLPTAENPASPCLASRISYGLEITQQRLKQAEKAEQFLKTLGLVEFRVRHHDTIARIEVHPEDLKKLTKEPARTKIIEKLKSLGFKYVTVDLQGFRSGSLNELLSSEQKEKYGG